MNAARGRLFIGLGCMLIACISGLNNVSEVVLAILGPDSLEGLMGGQPVFVQDNMQPYIDAMHAGIFRWGMLSLASLGVVAAGVLGLGGLALIARQRIATKLLSTWGFWGVVAGPVGAVLASRYVMPQVAAAEGQPMSDGAMVFNGLLTLVMLWVLPVGLLLLLRLPFMQADAIDSGASDKAQRVSVQRFSDDDAGNTHTPGVEARRTASLTQNNSETTFSSGESDLQLRDDPWNDPEAT